MSTGRAHEDDRARPATRFSDFYRAPAITDMKILFLHGLGSKPGGFKPTFLREQGFEVVNPGLPDDDFERSAQIAQDAFEAEKVDVVVASSRGGAVAMNIDIRDTPLVLIAPAWKRWGKATTVKCDTVILHSPADELVPIEDSRELLRSANLRDDALKVVGEGHYMTDDAALAALVDVLGKIGRHRT